MGTHRISFGQRSRAGFTIIELAIVIVVISVLLMPLLRIAASSIGATRIQDTGAALETARDALVAFAASNNGCLPFAADFEGGLPDTDATGVVTSSSVDTGFGTATPTPKHGGDLPWAELGLTNSFLDGDDLRVQYYVASPYTDDDLVEAGVTCVAGFRGFQWDSSVKYIGGLADGTPPEPLYVYFSAGGRKLYKIIGTLPAGISPDTPCVAAGDPLPECTGPGPNPVTEDITVTFDAAFPDGLVQVRRGPDVINGGASEITPVSAQTVFVLIAPGKNRNAARGRTHVRDANHVRNASGATWPLDFIFDGTNFSYEVIFSATQNIDGSDSNNDGDDTLLVMSFTNFKAALSKYGLNMESVCEGSC